MHLPSSSPHPCFSPQLLKDHPDLAGEFLAFLLPHQAMELGLYQEYCQQQRLLDLLYQLQVFMSPTV